MPTELKDAIQSIKDKGIKITPQRSSIYKYLNVTKAHLSADEIYKHLQQFYPSISIATVYNNLNVLKNANLIQELKFGSNSSLYEANTSLHYHAICKCCGEIKDINISELKHINDITSSKTNFKIDSHRIEFYGLCEDCSNQEINRVNFRNEEIPQQLKVN